MGEAEYIAGHALAYLRRRWRNGPDDDDTALERLDALISGAVGGDPAVLRLRLETEAAETSERTARRAELALEAALEDDPHFADEVGGIIVRLRATELADLDGGWATAGPGEEYGEEDAEQDEEPDPEADPAAIPEADPEAELTLANRAWIAYWTGEAGDPAAAKLAAAHFDGDPPTVRALG